MHVLETGERLHRAMEQGMDAFRALAQQLGYSPFVAHDLVRVYGAFARVADCQGVPLETLAHEARQLTFAKLSLIAPLLQKDPCAWAYWLELAQTLPLQDLQGPVAEALARLKA